MQQTAEVGASTALRDEPPTGRKRAVDAREELVVVEDPVEGCRAQHAVERVDEGQDGAVRADETGASTRTVAVKPMRPGMASEGSTATTMPSPRAATSSAVSRPVPQPISRTRSPGWGASRRRTRRPHSSCGFDTRW